MHISSEKVNLTRIFHFIIIKMIALISNKASNDKNITLKGAINQMKKKLIILDIDGTILDEKTKSVSIKTRYAIENARKNGNYVCIGTGRCKAEIGSEILNIGFDGIVCAAGAYITWKNKVIREKYIDKHLLNRMINLLKQSNSIYFMESTDYVYAEESIWRLILQRAMEGDQGACRLIMGYKSAVIEIEDISEISRVNKMVYFQSEYSFDYMYREMSSIDINVTALSLEPFCGNCGELTLKEYNKGEGIRFLTEYIGHNLSDTIAVGDSDNDIEMLKTAGIGIAMGNANENVKQIADQVTDTIEQDGVYNAFLKNNLIAPFDYSDSP